MHAGAVEGLPKDENEYEANQMVEILSGVRCFGRVISLWDGIQSGDGSGQSYDAGMRV